MCVEKCLALYTHTYTYKYKRIYSCIHWRSTANATPEAKRNFYTPRSASALPRLTISLPQNTFSEQRAHHNLSLSLRHFAQLPVDATFLKDHLPKS